MKTLAPVLLSAALFFTTGCFVRDIRWTPVRPPPGRAPRVVTLETTGYCSCGRCCGWTRNWFFRPVYASGLNRGKPKPVGLTASGVRARPGTIAADTSLFPFGTVMHVPGYGYGRVEDRGTTSGATGSISTSARTRAPRPGAG